MKVFLVLGRFLFSGWLALAASVPASNRFFCQSGPPSEIFCDLAGFSFRAVRRFRRLFSFCGFSSSPFHFRGLVFGDGNNSFQWDRAGLSVLNRRVPFNLYRSAVVVAAQRPAPEFWRWRLSFRKSYCSGCSFEYKV